MLRLAQTCLMVQIILAPLLLGGLRPWALAILAILTGIGMIAICLRPGPVKMRKHLICIWLGIAALIGWCVLQSLPVWPIQTFPFDTARIALVTNGWLGVAFYLIWLGGTITLTALVAQWNRHLHILIARTVIIACTLQVSLAASAELMGWQTTFWFAKQAHLGDWTGSFANRNAFGTLIGVGILACLFLYVQRHGISAGKQLDRAGGWLALAIIFTAALVQSHSRLGFVTTLAGAALFIILRPHQNARSFKRLLVIALGIFSTIILATIASPELFSRFSDLARSDLMQRDDLWATALQAIAQRPITGWGAESISIVISHFATPDLNANANWFSSHNLWLDGTLMFGIPAMLVLMAALAFAFKMAITTRPQPETRALVIALFSLGMLGSLGDWVMIMPALILPIVMLAMARLEDVFAASRVTPSPVDHAAQSRLPDPEALH